MLAETDRRARGNPGDDALQQLFSIEQRRLGEVVSVAVKQVEHEVPEAVVTPGFQIRLQIVEAGKALFVLHDDFAVDQRRTEPKTEDCIRDAAKPRRPVERFAGEKPRLAAVEARLNPIAIVLDLVNPFRTARRLVAGRGKARLQKRRQQAFAGAGNLSDVRQEKLSAACCRRPPRMVDAQLSRCRKFLVGAPADARSDFLVGDLWIAKSAGERVVGLDEEPWLGLLPAPRPHADQMPFAFEARTFELKREMPFGEPLVGIAFRNPTAVIPHNHRAAAVLAFGDVALEVEVLDRVVLGAHREPLLAEREAWAARDCPALEDAVKLEPQVVVEPARGVFLNHEGAGCPLPTLPRKRGRVFRFALHRTRETGFRFTLARLPGRVGRRGWLRRPGEVALTRIFAKRALADFRFRGFRARCHGERSSP